MTQPNMTPEEALREATRRQQAVTQALRTAGQYTVEERPTRPGEAEEAAGSITPVPPTQ